MQMYRQGRTANGQGAICVIVESERTSYNVFGTCSRGQHSCAIDILSPMATLDMYSFCIETILCLRVHSQSGEQYRA